MGMKQIKRGEMKPTKIGEYTNIHSEKYFYWKIIPKEDRVFYALLKEGEKPNKNTGGYYNKDYLIGVKKNIKLYKN